MKFTKERFFSIGSESGVAKEPLTAFWTALERDETATSSGTLSLYLYYLGAMIVIAAMGWFVNLSWESLCGGGIFLIATAYALLFLLAGTRLWNRAGLRVPAGLCITMAVCMTPLAIYGLEKHWNIWPDTSPES